MKDYDFAMAISGVPSHIVYHHVVSDWGESIYFMEIWGLYMARMYWYKDDPTIIYISELHVVPSMRRNGLGRSLIDICERVAFLLNATNVNLSVIDDSWMRHWYERLGYKRGPKEKEYVWMSKSIQK